MGNRGELNYLHSQGCLSVQSIPLLEPNQLKSKIETMKIKPLILSLACFGAISMSPLFAQEAVWQNSYKLEAAGKYTEAIAAIDSIPAAGPDGEFKVLRRAWLFYLSANYEDSIKEYRLAIDRNGKSVDAHLGVILPLMAEKRWVDAEQSAKSALELVPNNYNALLRLAIAQEAQTDWKGMEKTGQSLVEAYPTDASAYVYLARAKAWLGKKEEATAAYNAVLARIPGHLEAKAFIEKK